MKIRDEVRQIIEESSIVEDDVELLNYDYSLVDPAIHRTMFSDGQVADEKLTYQYTVRVRDPESNTIITLERAMPRTVTYGDDDEEDDSPDELHLDVTDKDWDEQECTECGHPWDQDEWEKLEACADRSGGMAIHECPEDGCEGRANVYF